MNFKLRLVVLITTLPLLLTAQTRKQKKAIAKADAQIESNLKNHVKYLASDELEGRRSGTLGEVKARDYIAAQFAAVGLEPAGKDNFIQPFEINEGKQYVNHSNLSIGGITLKPGEDFFPMPWSANGSFDASIAPALKEKGMPWIVDVSDWLEKNSNNPHYDILPDLIKYTNEVAQKGAIALLFYNSSSSVDNIQFNKFDQTATANIPVVYVVPTTAQKLFSEISSYTKVQGNVQIETVQRTAYNVVGWVNHQAKHTIIIGAHYDHLGYGEDKNTLDGNAGIHNGADDNASGTAALIELARLLKNSSAKNYNYLFIAFSGEELGLMGSKYWLDHPTVTINPNYMINMDMVGRYDTARKLTIGGYGTSPYWGKLFSELNEKNLIIKLDSAGTGPSDHASFYRKDIPVLFFFTGSHPDYHKVSDDYDKINYQAQKDIVRLVQKIIETSNQQPPLTFTKTREQQMGRSTRFTVSLGVIPDYGYTGTGMRIDGVSAGKIGEKIGLKAGDVLLQLGDYKFVDVNTYMTALSHFKKGDKTTLTILRGTETLSFEIEF